MPTIAAGLPVLGNLAALIARIRRGDIDQVIVALPWSADVRLQQIVSQLALTPVRIRLAPDLASFAFAQRPVVLLGEMPVMTLFERPISGLDAWAKAVEDRLLGGIALLLASPLLLLIAVAIRLDSPGPILFRQPREGFNNRPFHVFKFRSMYHGHAQVENIQQASRGDPRVTRVGRILRALSFDELPQLLNVMQGHDVVGRATPARGVDARRRQAVFRCRAELCGAAQGEAGDYRLGAGLRLAGRNRYRGQARQALRTRFVLHRELDDLVRSLHHAADVRGAGRAAECVLMLRRWLVGQPATAAQLRADGNAFTLLRWLLASSVLFSHAYDLTLGDRGQDPSIPVFGMPVAGLAVYLFFSLSGFLVTGSLVHRGWRSFAAARLLRLIPGLWVMLLVVTLGVGAAFGTLPLGEYLGDRTTWEFVLRNGSLAGAAYQLPGVFRELPAAAVNGSLWTIPQEVRCYLLLALAGVAGALASRRWATASLCVLIAVQLVVPLDAVPLLDRPRRLGLSFLLGVTAYLWRDRVRWSWSLGLAGVALALFLAAMQVREPVVLVAGQIAFAYLAGTAALRPPAAVRRLSTALPDYSYGIYIYAYPVQQAVIATGWGIVPLANLALSLPLAVVLAAASWHWVEKPALDLKSRWSRAHPAKLSGSFTSR